nr:RNA-directed DNA polymerase, eukaryota, reverse transcriptase zinc-binding domain protein [Tanacetum cinerariifolium]
MSIGDLPLGKNEQTTPKRIVVEGTTQERIVWLKPVSLRLFCSGLKVKHLPPASSVREDAYSTESHCSVVWKNILSLRDKVRSHIWWKIRKSRLVNVWHDKWCLAIPLSDFIDKRDVYDARLKNNCTVSDVVKEGQLIWPNEWNSDFEGLRQIQVPCIIKEKDDIVAWLSSLGHEKQFKVSNIWKDMNCNVTKVIRSLWSGLHSQYQDMLLSLALGWLLEEIHVTWAHLKKKRTRLRLYTKSLKELCIQCVETASRIPGNGVTTFKMTASEHENPIRTLGDYSKPSHEGYRNTIELPGGNNVVPLRSDTIRLVQNRCSFHGLRSEDLPTSQIFLKTCGLTRT